MEQDDFKVVLGKSKERDIYLSLAPHFKHMVFYGDDPNGRGMTLISLAKQEVMQKKYGVTFVIDSPFLAGSLYNALKPLKGRKEIKWFSPLLDLGIRNQLLWMDEYNEELIDRYILDYEQSIRRGDIVIIDLEPLRYGKYAERSLKLILHHLRVKLVQMNPTEYDGHYLYVENGKRCIDELSFFIEYGQYYQFGVCTWLESPEFWGKHLPCVEPLIQNVFLYSRFYLGDCNYFNKLFLALDQKQLLQRSPHMTLYNLVGANGRRYQGSFELTTMSEDEYLKMIANGKRAKSLLYREYVKKENENNQLLEGSQKDVEDVMDEDIDWRDFMKIIVNEGNECVPKHDDFKSLEELSFEIFGIKV